MFHLPPFIPRAHRQCPIDMVPSRSTPSLPLPHSAIKPPNSNHSEPTICFSLTTTPHNQTHIGRRSFRILKPTAPLRSSGPMAGELGGVIFPCSTHDSMRMCFRKNIFGSGDLNSEDAESIVSGVPLFVFNLADRQLHGVFVAVGPCTMNPETAQWEVKVRRVQLCHPLTEGEFKPFIKANYTPLRQEDSESLDCIIPGMNHQQAVAMKLTLPTFTYPLFTYVLNHQQAADLQSKFNDVAIYENEMSMKKRNCMGNQGAIFTQILDWMRDLHDQIKRPRVTLDRNQSIFLVGGYDGFNTRANSLTLYCSFYVISDGTRGGNEQIKKFDPEENNPGDLMVIGPADPFRKESIFLVGGWNGSSWLPNLDQYSPSRDVLKSLCPMHQARSSMGVAKFSEQLYVLAGNNPDDESNSVESYDWVTNEWSIHPSLKQKRCCLAGAVANNKIYAVGGRNGTGSLSTVETYHGDGQEWTTAVSMLQKRCDLGVAELAGVLYAVGGYDGKKVLQCAERLDPKDGEWKKIIGMSSPRRTHSLVALNGKLFAVGGYNGSSMLSSVEIYDPRLGYWFDGEPIHVPRGIAAAAVLDDLSFCVIGGASKWPGHMRTSTVERYVDGQGWHLMRNFNGPREWIHGSAIGFK